MGDGERYGRKAWQSLLSLGTRKAREDQKTEETRERLLRILNLQGCVRPKSEFYEGKLELT